MHYTYKNDFLHYLNVIYKIKFFILRNKNTHKIYNIIYNQLKFILYFNYTLINYQIYIMRTDQN